MGSLFAYALGYGTAFVAGWVARNLSDSPQGVTGKLLEAAQDAKERLLLWTSLQRERLEDLLAEAQAGTNQDVPDGEPPQSDNDELIAKEKAKDNGNADYQHKERAVA